MDFDPPNALTNNAPRTGENMMGVKKETPNRPYFLQNVTNLLFLLLNSFRFLLKILSIQFLSPGPKEETTNTEVIIPEIVSKVVSQKLSPKAIPMVGPPINLNMLIKKTVTYFPIIVITIITIQRYMYNRHRSKVE